MIPVQMLRSMHLLHLSWHAWSSLARQTCDADRTALAHSSMDLLMQHAVFVVCCLQMPSSIGQVHASDYRQLSSKVTPYILAYCGETF